MPRNPRVALCFFGKHGDDAGPSRADVAVARTVPPAHREKPADALYCFNDAGGRVGRGLDNLTALPHPEALNRQCPWEFTLACHADTNCAGRAAPSPPS